MTRLVAEAVLAAPVLPAGMGAVALRDAIAAGTLRVEDVVRAHLDRIDEVQPSLNAAVHVCREQALLEARRLQVRLDAGEQPGPLCGVPFTVKDVIATAHVPTACGSAAFAGNVPVVDAVAVQRLRAAGAVLVAKTNCPEFAFGITTSNVAFGETRSPWGAASPGGSSGGEAALVAAGGSAFGIGTDYGGSLRWPAQSCGIIALRPTVGAVDRTGQLPEVGGRLDGRGGDGTVADSIQRHFQMVGPLARSAADVAAVLAVLVGDGAADVVADPLAFGWVEREDTQPVGRAVSGAIAELVGQLRRGGAVVQPCPGLLDGLHQVFNDLRATDPLADLRRAIGDRRAVVGPDASRTLDAAPASNAAAGPLWDELARRCSPALAQLRRTPVLLVPVAPVGACTLDFTADVDGEIVTGFALMAQCRAVTALACPSLSIPIGRDDGGMPVSVQLVGAPGREADVLRAALLLEQLGAGAIAPPWLVP